MHARLATVLIAISAAGIGYFLNGGQQQSLGNSCLNNLAYTDAVVYAGSVDYVFEFQQSKLVTFKISNEDSSSQPFFELLTESIDGPAEPNLALFGKKYSICIEDNRLAIEEEDTD